MTSEIFLGKFNGILVVEYYNNAITKSAGNPLTSLLPTSLPPTSLPPTSLPPAFNPLVSPSTASKKFNYYYTSTSLKRQANRIAV
jgi:hypothetical protein